MLTKKPPPHEAEAVPVWSQRAAVRPARTFQ